METFVDRMREERNQLGERIMKGIDFIKSEKFKTLSATERYLIEGQISSMQAYFNYLQLRIDYYK